MNKIAVLTENKRQFDYWLQEVEYEDKKKFVYVGKIEDILGHSFVDVIRVGRYWNSTTYYDLYENVLSRGVK